MKKLFATLFLLVLLPLQVYAGYVNGYYRSNGTYVNGYYRTTADGNPYNNYSTPGNYNPNTGTVTGGSLDSYINRYYNNNSGSSYTNSYNSGSYLGNSVSGGSNSSVGSYIGGTYVPPATTGSVDSYTSSYRTVTGGYFIGTTLYCSYGYYKQNDSSCIQSPSNSTSYGSTDFSCNTGYYRQGNDCTKLPDNSHILGSGWQCDSGYRNMTYYCQKISGSIVNGSLQCDVGSVVNSSGDDCIAYDTKCREILSNTNASYNPSTKTCSCPIGTVQDGSSCVSMKTACQRQFGPASYDLGDKCSCLDGYDFDTNKQCSPKPIPTLATTTAIVTTTSQVNNSTTTDQGQTCKVTYGEGSYSKGSLCYCSQGFQWDIDLKHCSSSKKVITKSLSFGSKGDNVVILKNFLANQNLYSGYVNTSYDRETSASVVSFQRLNGIPQTGTVGNLTRSKINSLMYKN
jgi:Putative peptidoglycan binding domain